MQNRIPPHLLNKVVQGDCLELMNAIPAAAIDLILCDLPYGVTQNPWDRVIDLNLLWQHYKRIIKPNGAVLLTANGLFTGKLILSNADWFRYKIIWIKSKAPNFLQANRQPMKKHEDICVFYKEQPVYHPQMISGKPYDKGVRKSNCSGCYGKYKAVHCASNGERYPHDVLFYEDEPPDWLYCKTADTEGKTCHPSQKPVDLGRYLIRTFSNPGDIVLDNACGSGSFLVAAIRENRHFIGMEKNENSFRNRITPVDFIGICKKRINDELNTPKTK